MIQQVKVLVDKSDALSSVPGTYVVEGKNNFEAVLWFPLAGHGTPLFLSQTPLTHTLNLILKSSKILWPVVVPFNLSTQKDRGRQIFVNSRDFVKSLSQKQQ